MAIKNLFGRGIGFASGVVSWVVTRGFGNYSPPAPGTENYALSGVVFVGPALTGTVAIEAALSGSVAVSPALTGTITLQPS